MSSYMSTDMVNYNLLGNSCQNEIFREHFNNIPSDIIDNIVDDEIQPKYISPQKQPLDDRFIRFFEPRDWVKYTSSGRSFEEDRYLPLSKKLSTAIKTAIQTKYGCHKTNDEAKLYNAYVKMKRELEPKMRRKFGIIFNQTLNIDPRAKIYDTSKIISGTTISIKDLVNNIATSSQDIINSNIVKYINEYTNKIREDIDKYELGTRKSLTEIADRYAGKVVTKLGILLYIIYDGMYNALSYLNYDNIKTNNNEFRPLIEKAIEQILDNLHPGLDKPKTDDIIKAKLAVAVSERIKDELKKSGGKFNSDQYKYHIKDNQFKNLCKSVKRVLIQSGCSIKDASKEASETARQIIAVVDKKLESPIHKPEDIKKAVGTALVKQGIDQQTASKVVDKVVVYKDAIKNDLIAKGVDNKVASVVAVNKATDLKDQLKEAIKNTGVGDKDASVIASPITAAIKDDVKKDIKISGDSKLKSAVSDALKNQGIKDKLVSELTEKVVDEKQKIKSKLVDSGVDSKTASVTATLKAIDLKEDFEEIIAKNIDDKKTVSKIATQVAKEVKKNVITQMNKDTQLKNVIIDALMKQGLDKEIASQMADKAIEVKNTVKSTLIKQGVKPKEASIVATDKAIDMKQQIKDILVIEGKSDKEASKIASPIAKDVKDKIGDNLGNKLKDTVKSALLKQDVPPKVASVIATEVAKTKKDIKKELIKNNITDKDAPIIATKKALDIKNNVKKALVNGGHESKEASKIASIVTAEVKKEIKNEVKKDIKDTSENSKLKETIKTSLIKQNAPVDVASTIATSAADVKQIVKDSLIDQGVDKKVASVVATQKALDIKDNVKLALVNGGHGIKEASKIASVVADTVKTDVKKNVAETIIDKDTATKNIIKSTLVKHTITDKIASNIANKMISEGIRDKVSDITATKKMLDIKNDIKNALIEQSSEPKLMAAIVDKKVDEIINEINANIKDKPSKSSKESEDLNYMLIRNKQKDTSPYSSIKKTIKVVKTIKPESLAKKLAVYKIDGVDIDHRQRKLVYTVIISAIQTMISQILAIPEPLHPDDKRFLNRLVSFIINERRIMALARRVATNEKFIELLHVEHFGDNSYDNIMSIISQYIKNPSDEYYKNDKCEFDMMPILLLIVIGLIAIIVYRYYKHKYAI